MTDTDTEREWGRTEIESPEKRIEELEAQIAELTEQLGNQIGTLTDRLEEHQTESGSFMRR